MTTLALSIVTCAYLKKAQLIKTKDELDQEFQSLINHFHYLPQEQNIDNENQKLIDLHCKIKGDFLKKNFFRKSVFALMTYATYQGNPSRELVQDLICNTFFKNTSIHCTCTS